MVGPRGFRSCRHTPTKAVADRGRGTLRQSERECWLILQPVVHSRSTQTQLTTALSTEDDSHSLPRVPGASWSAVVGCGHLLDHWGLENRRPFTGSAGSNPAPSATFTLLSTAHSMSLVHSWSIGGSTLDGSPRHSVTIAGNRREEWFPDHDQVRIGPTRGLK